MCDSYTPVWVQAASVAEQLGQVMTFQRNLITPKLIEIVPKSSSCEGKSFSLPHVSNDDLVSPFSNDDLMSPFPNDDLMSPFFHFSNDDLVSCSSLYFSSDDLLSSSSASTFSFDSTSASSSPDIIEVAAQFDEKLFEHMRLPMDQLFDVEKFPTLDILPDHFFDLPTPALTINPFPPPALNFSTQQPTLNINPFPPPALNFNTQPPHARFPPLSSTFDSPERLGITKFSYEEQRMFVGMENDLEDSLIMTKISKKMKRAPKVRVPDSVRETEKYQKYRHNNNIHARRNRAAKAVAGIEQEDSMIIIQRVNENLSLARERLITQRDQLIFTIKNSLSF